jgi:hypothetical protein
MPIEIKPKKLQSLKSSIAQSLIVTAGMLMVSQSAAFAHGNKVSITNKGNQRCIASNGLPNHSTGQFPNRGNPNSISTQKVSLCFSSNPKKGKRVRFVRGSVGVALNGVQFRPGTADYYDPSSPRGFSRDRRSGWNLEGLGARDKLGMDRNDAHVDHRGLYHYHGVASVLAQSAKGTLIGYAADGFAIHYVGNQKKSSYRLKPGNRKSGPGGKHDGTYNEDWQYVAGSGSLDQCNGGLLNGKFVYFATKSYPFFPRCMWGAVSSDFTLGRPQNRNAKQSGLDRNRPGLRRANPRNTQLRNARPRNAQSRNGNQRNARLRNANGRQPPLEAIAACQSARNNARCSFKAPNGRQVRGNCRTTPDSTVACVPRR